MNEIVNNGTMNFYFWLGEDGGIDMLTEEGFEQRIERARNPSDIREAEDLERND